MNQRSTYLLLIFCLCTISLWGQDDDPYLVGHIKGRISDRAAVDEVAYTDVRLVRNGALVQSTKTNEDGDYFLREILEGQYDMVVYAMGYPPIKVHNVRVDVGEMIELNLEFPGESYDNDTLFYEFEEVNAVHQTKHEKTKKRHKCSKKKKKARRRQERAAKRLD